MYPLISVCLLATLPTFAQWPANDEDLLFLFENSFEEIFALDASLDESLLNYALLPKGWARYNSNGAMELAQGQYSAPNQEHLLSILQESETFSLEFITQTNQAQKATILSLGPWLSVSQAGNELVIRFATKQGHATINAPFTPGRHHIVLTRKANQWQVFVDGTAGKAQAVMPHFNAFSPTFGSGNHKQVGWSGTLSHVAIYEGSFDATRAKAHATTLERQLADSSKTLELTGKLVATSKVATPAEIEPYAASLSIHEYEVVKIHQGFSWDKRIRVAHWVVLDHQALPVAQAQMGAHHRLFLEPFAANRQLANTHRTETLPPDAKMPLFLATNIVTEP